MLGPIFFIYIYDLFITSSLTTFMFADNTAWLASCHNSNNLTMLTMNFQKLQDFVQMAVNVNQI
jgi:hypothetical protein